MSKSRAQENLSITRFEFTKRLLVAVGLGCLLLLCLMLIRSSPRTGWFGGLVFGVMTLLAAYDLFKIRDHRIVKGEGIRANIRSSLIWTGTFIVTLFFGLLERILAEFAFGRLPILGIWLATFVTSLAFYPFRGKEAREELPTLQLWALYCALAGVLSIGIAQFSRWLD